MKRVACTALVLALVLLSPDVWAADRRASEHRSPRSHYLYVFPDGAMYVYDIRNDFSLVKRVELPQARGIRGVAANPATGMLFLSYSPRLDAGGALLKYDLLRDQVVWTRQYDYGIDSFDITPDGKTIFMPTGELDDSDKWKIIDAESGDTVGEVQGGAGPHNTVVSPDGRYVYLGPRESDHLTVVRTSDRRIERRIGPLRWGVRPFTINGAQTLAFTTATAWLGFQVSSIETGRVLYSVPIQDFEACNVPRLGPLRRYVRLALARFYVECHFIPTSPSHGISLSPDEREVWLINGPHSYVHVFDVSGLPQRVPRRVADIRLRSMMGEEHPCAYDCHREGWLAHSCDGRYVFVGDSGDVIDTRTRAVVANLDTLYNSRKFLEIDWQDGKPVFTTTRHGLGQKR